MLYQIHQNITHERTIKILSIIALFFLILPLAIIATTPPARGYEISIYDAYPWYFWFFIILTILLGQIIIFKDAFSVQSDTHKRLWILGLVVIILPIIILLLLPYFRGYPIYNRYDTLYHIGYIRNIMDFGRINQENIYPNLHILIAFITNVCNCNIEDIVNFFPLFFFFIFPISLYIFYRTIFDNQRQILLALIFISSFLLFGSFSIYLAQYLQSFFLLPLILFLFFKIERRQNILFFFVLLFILIFSITIFHPLNSLLLILCFFIFLAVLYFYEKINRKNKSEKSNKINKQRIMYIILFSIVIYIAWYFSYSWIIKDFYKIFLSILVGGTTSFFKTQLDILGSHNVNILDLIKMAIYIYGKYLIIGFLSFISIIYIFIHRFRNKEKKLISILYSFSVLCFLLFGVLAAGAFFTNFIVNWDRFMHWAVFFSFILISLVFSVLLSNSKFVHISIKKSRIVFKSIIMFIILIFLVFLSVFTFFLSPNVLHENIQVTYTEWVGSKWFFDYRNEQFLIDQLGIPLITFSNAISGIQKNIYNIPDIDSVPVNHFGFTTNSTLNEIYKDNKYLIITQLGKIYYPSLYLNYREYWRFTENDFSMLLNDSSVTKVYSNSGFDVLLINSR